MQLHRESPEPGARDYPYFELRVWEGRLPTPPEFRGTPIARQFESGRIGGKRIAVTARFADNVAGRRDLVAQVRKCREVEIAMLVAANRYRQAVHRQEIFRPNFIREGLMRPPLSRG